MHLMLFPLPCRKGTGLHTGPLSWVFGAITVVASQACLMIVSVGNDCPWRLPSGQESSYSCETKGVGKESGKMAE